MSANFVTTVMRTGILAAFLALGACGDSDPTPIVPDLSTGQALSLAPTRGGTAGAPYRLGPNDRTRIIVYGQPTLTGEFVLDGNGSLAYPLIGNIDANGMTPSELQALIAQKLDKDWVNNPSVAVEVSTRRPFYIVGEVHKPGSMKEFYIKRKQDGRVVRVLATQETQLQPNDTVIVRERLF